ncbi:MAG: TetR/AcrR family transcriptional regulator [Acidimicrobiales bacterium]
MATETVRSSDAADDATLDAAIREFRIHGFVGTSVQLLVNATGRSRSSLYNRFGDKNGLFVAALERYLEETCPFGEGETTVAQLRTLIEFLHSDGELSPCLLARSCSELPDLPEAARPLITAALERQWNAMIDSPSGNGDVNRGTVALALRHGISSLAAAGVPPEVLHSAVDTYVGN